MAKMKSTTEGGVSYTDKRMAFSSTKPEMVLKESEQLTVGDVFGDVFGKNSKLVVCEDQNGLYLSSKANVGSTLLDGFRMYFRNEYKITKNETDDYTVKIDGKTITV